MWALTKTPIKSIYGAYTKPSQAKIDAWNKIENERLKNNGFCLEILTHNTFHFVTMYCYFNEKTADTVFVIHTPTQRVETTLEEIDKYKEEIDRKNMQPYLVSRTDEP